MINKDKDITGSKGGKGGGDKPRSAKESPNTLRSSATARIIDVISEGEIGGLVNGLNSVIFDQTPVVSASGATNISGVAAYERTGLPSQSYIPGFPNVESEVGVGVLVRQSPAVIRAVSSIGIDAARVVVRVDSLYTQNKENGDITGRSVTMAVDVRVPLGTWSNVITNTISGKTMTAYERSYRVESPDPDTLWEIRVRRVSANNDLANIGDNTSWSRFTEITDVKETYDDTALVALEVDAEAAGNRVPRRSYLVDGIKCRIPANYNPVTHTYTGQWDGSFKLAREVTDDPAWIIYEILTNDRWGMGSAVEDDEIDKWSFFYASVYNNEFISDGGNTGGTEPRYRFAGVVNTRQDPYKLIQAIAASCRATIFTSGGLIKLVQDRPSDTVKWITNEDVEDGLFEYKGSSVVARTTSVNVTYNDESDGFLPSTVTEEDAVNISRYGFNQVDMIAYGAFTEGQARRVAKWLLYNNTSITEAINFRTGFNHADLEPGDVIEVLDKDYAGVNWGGRIVSGTETSITLDQPAEITSAVAHTVHLLGNDGFTWLERTINEGIGTHTVLTWTDPVGTVQPWHVWVLEGDIVPRSFKILAIRETEVGKFEINAIQHNPAKYAAVEQGVVVATNPFSNQVLREINAPTDIDFVVEQSVDNLGRPFNALRIDWNQPIGEDSTLQETAGYLVKWSANALPSQTSEFLTQSEFLINPAVLGSYTVEVYAFSVNNIQSPALTGTFVMSDQELTVLADVTNVRTVGQGNTTFRGTGFTVTWDDPNDDDAQLGGARPVDYRVEVKDSLFNTVLRTFVTTQKQVTYDIEMNSEDYTTPSRSVYFTVKIRDTVGRYTVGTNTTITNAPPLAPSSVTLYGYFNSIRIDVDGFAADDSIGVVAWVKESSGYIPSDTNFDYSARSQIGFDVAAESGKTYYVRAAGYDGFGFYDLTPSSEQAVTTVQSAVTFITPNTPPNLALTTESTVADNGQEYISLTATWDTPISIDGSSLDITTGFDIALAEGAGGYVVFRTNDNTYTWSDVKPAQAYTVRVRALNAAVQGNYTATQTLTTAADSIAPGEPTGLTATGSFKNVFLAWTNPTDSDLSYIEVYESASNNRASATLIVTSDTDYATISAKSTTATTYYWLRAVDTSGNFSAFAPLSATAGVSATTVQTTTADYQDLSIVNAKIANLSVDQAKIANATITNAKIANATIESAKIAEVTAEKITISGGTTLSDWRNGSDTTKLDGGNIATNTIKANRIEVGSRNVRFSNIVWEPVKATDTLTWTGGSVVYERDSDSEPKSITITSGNVVWTSGTVYVYWVKDATTFSTTTTSTVAYGSDRMVVATYNGGTTYAPLYGSTIIDGTNIVTGSITASQLIQTEAIIANSAQLGVATIDSANIRNLQVDTIKIANAAVSNLNFISNGTDTLITAYDVYEFIDDMTFTIDSTQPEDYMIVTMSNLASFSGVSLNSGSTLSMVAKFTVRNTTTNTELSDFRIVTANLGRFASGDWYATGSTPSATSTLGFTSSRWSAGDVITATIEHRMTRTLSTNTFTNARSEAYFIGMQGFKK